mgnify:FL=1
MDIGQRIRECRSAKKLTLQQIGDHFGINRASVSDWENDKTRPDLDRIVSLARLLGTSVDYLLAGRSTPGSWPFQSIPYENYASLTTEQKRRLEEKVADFIDGARPQGRSTSSAA